MSKSTVLLVDAYATIYRAFHAIPMLTSTDGQPVNAVLGCLNMLRKSMADYCPSHAAIVFDLGAPQARLDILPDYKAQRPPTPDDLEAQLPIIRDTLEALRIKIVEQEGEEADDLIGTLAEQAALAGHRVIIVSGDKDFFQLVQPNVVVARPDGKQTILYDEDRVRERYGVMPRQFVDLLSLVGDTIDNIKGIPGVGFKTAASLLNQFDTLDNLLAHAAAISRPKLREALLNYGPQALRNRTLVKLNTNLRIECCTDLDALRVQKPDYAALCLLCRSLGFKKLLQEFEKQNSPQGNLF